MGTLSDGAPAYPAMIPLYVWFILSSICLRIIEADAQIISVVSSSETEVTLNLYKDYRNCNYTLYCFSGEWQQIPQPYQDFVTTYRVQFLSPGSRYYFYFVAICEGNYINYGLVTAVTSKLLFFSFFYFGLQNISRLFISLLQLHWMLTVWLWHN